jgi:hypothetical protein
MQIQINDTLRAYIDPLTEAEYTALERSILAEGCRDALVLWNDVLVDGHNRYAICQQHGIPFKVTQNTSFRSMEDVMLWMIDNHLGRRSVTDFQRGVLALRRKDILEARAAEQAVRAAAEDAKIAPPQPAEEAAEAPAPAKVRTSREDVARAARLSTATISQIEKIQKSATPELVEAVRAGTISINAAATVASLPQEEQVLAVAGGKKQLQQAAKEVREQRAANRPPKQPREDSPEALAAPAPTLSEVELLRAEVARLTERNAQLRAENAELRERIASLVDAG